MKLSISSVLLASLTMLQITSCSPAPEPSDDSAVTISQKPDLGFEELWDLTARFFDAFVYPENIKQTKEVNSTIFSQDVLGRVDVTRTFVGRELNTEYVFGLFTTIATNLNAFTLLGLPINYTITHFAANQNIASTALIAWFNVSALHVVVPVEVDFWATYNSEKQISQYDATFRWLDWQFQYLFNVGQKLLGFNSTAKVQDYATMMLAESICKTATTYCNGTNTQYNSTKSCLEFLGGSIRFGQAYELGMNTLLCRMVHQNMVPFRPKLHCPHIGPSGGGYCNDDRTYPGMVQQDFFTNAPFVPYGKPSTQM